MNFSNKNIFKLGIGLILILILTILTLYMFLRPDPAENTSGKDVVINNQSENNGEINNVTESDQEVVNNIVNNAITGSTYSYTPYNSDEYATRPELTEDLYQQYYSKIELFAGGQNWDAIKSLADQVYSKYQINNEDWLSFILVCTDIGSFSGDEWAKQLYLSTVNDAQLYVALFSSLSTQEQAAYLPRLNMTVLPDGTNQTVSVVSVEEDVGPYYSEAYRYFSDFDTTKITKITLKYEDSGSYEVYFAFNPEYDLKMITNIANTNKSSQTNTTYEEYFKFSGLEPSTIIYD